MSLPHALDELEYRLPARHAIRLRGVSARLRMAAIHLRYWQRRAERYVWWIVAIAGVLAYLTVATWIDNQELKDSERVRDRAIARMNDENADLRAKLAEATGTRTQKLIYLIEAGSTTEAKDKLSRLAMMIASEHFALTEATSGGVK